MTEGSFGMAYPFKEIIPLGKGMKGRRGGSLGAKLKHRRKLSPLEGRQESLLQQYRQATEKKTKRSGEKN